MTEEPRFYTRTTRF